MFCASRAGVRSLRNSIAARQFSTIFSKISYSIPRINIVAKRDVFSSILFKREQKFMQIDNIPSDYKLIYRLTNSHLWWACYVISYASVPYLAYQFYCYISPPKLRINYSIRPLDEVIDDVTSSPFQASENQLKFIFAVAIITLGSFLMFTKRVALRAYFNGERYIAIFINSYLPVGRTKYEFTTAKARTWTIMNGGFFQIGNRRAYLFQEHFKTPGDYFRFSNNYYRPIANKKIFQIDD